MCNKDVVMVFHYYVFLRSILVESTLDLVQDVGKNASSGMGMSIIRNNT